MRHALIPLLPVLVWLSPAVAPALSEDRKQPLFVESDSATLDDRQGVSVYRGNVRVTQGTLAIGADELTLYSTQGEVTKVIATGKPATFRQRPDGKTQDVEAQSLRMEYLVKEEKLILLQKGQIKQGADTFRSDRIVYDIGRDQVNAGAGGPGDRVRITIQPRPDAK